MFCAQERRRVFAVGGWAVSAVRLVDSAARKPELAGHACSQ